MQKTETAQRDFDVVVVGGGSAGIGVTASLPRRRPGLRIAVIEPSDNHYYQPAWTLVGGGAFDVAKTVRPTQAVMPARATWLRAAVAGFEPESDTVRLADGRAVSYRQLIVCPGLRLAWDKVEGLSDTLGKHGVSSNHRYDLAPYTWELVRGFQGGQACSPSPPCRSNAPARRRRRTWPATTGCAPAGPRPGPVRPGRRGAVRRADLRAAADALCRALRHRAELQFHAGGGGRPGAQGLVRREERRGPGQPRKGLRHAARVPPQLPHDFVRNSPLADAAGWCEVDPATLRHPRYANVFGLGDTISASNAKTAAAARKQIVAVAENLIACLDGYAMPVKYDGYGSCPLTVERGRIVLAEFGYGGKLLPTFPLDPTVPRKSAWFLKATLLPWIYWNGMLKGREWLARPLGN